MNYLIVPLGQQYPRHEGGLRGMELIHALNTLAGMGIVISIPAGLAIWNKIAKSGRWRNYRQAKADPEFWRTFKNEINKGQS